MRALPAAETGLISRIGVVRLHGPLPRSPGMVAWENQARLSQRLMKHPEILPSKLLLGFEEQ
jgi:hypothetical protein